MDDFAINRLISNPMAILGGLAFLIFVAHVILIYWLRVSEKGWKIVDYLWLGLAVIGLLSLAAEARMSIATGWLKLEQSRLDFSIEQIRDWSHSPENSGHCRAMRRTEFSPDDFDERVRQSDQLCDWVKEASKTIEDTNFDERENLALDNFHPPQFDYPFLEAGVERLGDLIHNYNSQLGEFNNIKNRTYKNGLEDVLMFLSPVVLMIALALRITKVTAEYRRLDVNRH